jgi:hypothetical protein
MGDDSMRDQPGFFDIDDQLNGLRSNGLAGTGRRLNASGLSYTIGEERVENRLIAH